MRTCDGCGVKMPAFKPRRKANEDGQRLCEGCVNGRPGRPVGHHGSLSCDACKAPMGDAGMIVTAGKMTCAAGCKTASWSESVPGESWHFWDDTDGEGTVGVREWDDNDNPISYNWRSIPFEGGDTEGEATTVEEAKRNVEEALRSGQMSLFAKRQAALRKQAHDSGDGATIYHCLAGETRYLTRDGVKTLADTVGTSQMVLTNPGNGGTWVEAEIREFGEQRLYAVTVQRNKTTKVIHATDGHRWVKAGQSGFITTMDLKTGDRLPSVLPRSLIGASTPSPFGIAHGITYGDGTRAAKGSVVRLWGEKDAQLLRYFSESRTTPVKTEKGVEGQMVLDLPAFFKDRPSLDESIPYLYGWLAGYFAADGSVSKQGQAILTSSSRENLEFVQTLCLRLGVATYPITEKVRQGYGEANTLYGMQFINSTLRPAFFLVREHQDRYVEAMTRGNPERTGWTVVSVEPTDRVETVYCAVVPGTQTFTLEDYLLTGNCPFCGAGQVTARSDGTIECGFCNNFFTVQVQPTHQAMPQTDPATGQPLNMPGMPGDPAAHEAPVPAPLAEDPGFAPEGTGGDEGFAPAGTKGAQFLPAGTGNHVAASRRTANDTQDELDDAEEDPCSCCGGTGEHASGHECYRCDATGNEKDASGSCDEETLAKDASRMYLTPDGVAIPEKSYLASLALRFADDRAAVLSQVRNERTAR